MKYDILGDCTLVTAMITCHYLTEKYNRSQSIYLVYALVFTLTLDFFRTLLGKGERERKGIIGQE